MDEALFDEGGDGGGARSKEHRSSSAAVLEEPPAASLGQDGRGEAEGHGASLAAADNDADQMSSFSSFFLYIRLIYPLFCPSFLYC